MSITLEDVMREYLKELPLEDQLVVSVFHARCKKALQERQAKERNLKLVKPVVEERAK